MNGVTNGQNDGHKPVRVWVDGCFDMVHYGHANLIRQAKLQGDYLIVGLHSDEEIEKHKGPPVFNLEERYRVVSAIKWVDEVVKNAPYCTTLEILEKYDCDFVCHGDDISVMADGQDAYGVVKKAGKYREVSRTHGVSTTDIVGRMLLLTKMHHKREGEDMPDTKHVQEIQKDSSGHSPWTGVSQFLTTTQKIVQFSGGKEPKPGDRIVYVAGAFDCFHLGHLSFLEKASEYGDFLIVGIHSDNEVNRYRGSNYPVMNLHERVLSVLACKYVHEVVIGAPFSVTADLMNHFKVDIVVHGRSKVYADAKGIDPYAVPMKQGKFKLVDSGSSMTTFDLVDRIIQHRAHFVKRNQEKEKKELTAYSDSREGVTSI